VELAIQDLQVDDAASVAAAAAATGSESRPGSESEPGTGPGAIRERQGVKRDLDEAGSAAKRRKEFHPQVNCGFYEKLKNSYLAIRTHWMHHMNFTSTIQEELFFGMILKQDWVKKFKQNSRQPN